MSLNYKTLTSRSFKNRDKITDSTSCTCYHCESRFNGSEIEVWVDCGQTALCPFCDIDAVAYEDEAGQFSDELLHDTMQSQFEIYYSPKNGNTPLTHNKELADRLGITYKEEQGLKITQ